MNKKNFLYFIILVLICCISYIYTHRYVVVNVEKNVFVYDTMLNKMALFGMRGIIYDNNGAEKDKYFYDKASDMVIMTANFDKDCSSDFPIKVSVDNHSQETILLSEFNLDIRERDVSSSLIDIENNNLYHDIKYKLDLILEPNMTGSACYKIPSIRKKIENEKLVVEPYGIVYTFKDISGGNENFRKRFVK